MDSCFPQVAGISVSPGILLALAFQPPNHESTMQAVKCRFVLPEQISGVRYLAIPCLHSLPVLFLFLPQVSWGGERASVLPGHSFGILPCSVRSALLYTVWCSLPSRCSFRISCINYIFIFYVVFGGSHCLTSHTTIFNPKSRTTFNLAITLLDMYSKDIITFIKT